MKATIFLIASLSSLAVSQRINAETKQRICRGFENDEKCRVAYRACVESLSTKKQSTGVENVIKCLDGRRPKPNTPETAPTKPKEPAAPAKPEQAQKESPPPSKPAQGAAEPNKPKAAIKADIRVDTNRDGVVDLEGSSDVAGKNQWTETSGAIFLANIGDSKGRCKDTPAFKNRATPLEELAKCHDAEDDEQRADKYLAPMRTVPITGLSKSAKGRVTVPDAKVEGLVRIFHSNDDGKSWKIVKKDTVFSAQDLEKGLRLGVDARDVRRPNVWDGKAVVEFYVEDGETKSKDTVMLRVAPVLLHHHRQAVEKVFADRYPDVDKKKPVRDYLDRLHRDVSAAMKSANIREPLKLFAESDFWVQDWFEPAYTSMPGPKNTTVSLRINIAGRRADKKESSRLLYTELRGDGVGGIEASAWSKSFSKIQQTLQAGGNIETIPPHEHNGKKYPTGRVVYGGNDQAFLNARDFFKAQGMQEPLMLDSTWLSVKHLDEMIQFVPAKSERGWAVLAVDPDRGIDLLTQLKNAGKGDQRLVNRGNRDVGPTVKSFLADERNSNATKLASQRMKANLQLLMKETGIKDEEIYRLPFLVGPEAWVSEQLLRVPYQRRSSAISRRVDAPPSTAAEIEAEEKNPALDVAFRNAIERVVPLEKEPTSAKMRRQASSGGPLDSYLPNPVNGVPLSDTHYMAPKPHGPGLGDLDIFQDWTERKLKEVGFTNVIFVDEWLVHANGGELHCMTNTYRDVSQRWW
ncbi:Protein-arginine deiminase [Moelleriella libera RCEF 2490]|uniref:Protein-arginine deiminase n=1 Tax=Moelleriella libera RCEF 2490 TaxID=1081109 RepID=A0A167ZEJ8_9HYPO|nr:Protein-arginine deiminase [Moelleriella libera RCEF 2490]